MHTNWDRAIGAGCLGLVAWVFLYYVMNQESGLSIGLSLVVGGGIYLLISGLGKKTD